jgi:hypothetical protein
VLIEGILIYLASAQPDSLVVLEKIDKKTGRLKEEKVQFVGYPWCDLVERVERITLPFIRRGVFSSEYAH